MPFTTGHLTDFYSPYSPPNLFHQGGKYLSRPPDKEVSGGRKGGCVRIKIIHTGISRTTLSFAIS